MKKMLCCALCLLLVAALTAGAEGIRLRTVLQYMPGISAVKGTDYVIVTEKFDHTKTVYNTEGKKLASFPYTNLAYAGYGYFTAWNTEDGKSLALVDISGNQVTEAKYGAFKVYNNHWAAGYYLTQAKKGSYSHGKVRYNIDGYDFFYIGDDRTLTEPIGFISSADFKSIGVHGDYIAVLYKDKSIHVFDKTFTEHDYTLKKVTNSIYGVTDYTIFNRISGESVGEGFTSVREQYVNGEFCLLVSRYDFEGKEIFGIIDGSGREIMPSSYYVSSVNGDYAVVTNDEGLYGLYSISDGRQVVPCEFYGLPVNELSTDKYVQNGYVLVENGTLRGYYDTVSGAVSCEVKYEAEEYTAIGCTMIKNEDEGVFTLVAADGAENEVYVDAISTDYSHGNGHYLVAMRNGMYGVIDWHGKEILPFVHAKPIVITDDSRAFIRTGTGMQLDVIE